MRHRQLPWPCNMEHCKSRAEEISVMNLNIRGVAFAVHFGTSPNKTLRQGLFQPGRRPPLGYTLTSEKRRMIVQRSSCKHSTRTEYSARGRLGRLDTLSNGSGVALLVPHRTTDQEAQLSSLIASMIHLTRGTTHRKSLSWHLLA